jgi:predicted GIY-YIG superfamily endonuclease
MFIYKLVSAFTDATYVGKTKDPDGRLGCHKSDFKRYLREGNKSTVCTSIQILQYADVDIVVLEANVEEENVVARERYWIENSPTCVNKYVPGRKPMEYYWAKPAEYREALNKKKREYAFKNKEKITAHNNLPEVRDNMNAVRRNRRKNEPGYKEKLNASKREWFAKSNTKPPEKLTCQFCCKLCNHAARYIHWRTGKCTSTRRQQYAERVIARFMLAHTEH